MELSGEYLIPAPREKVWQALNDPQVLKACIPGCQELVRLSDGELSAKVMVKVGAIQAPFGGRIVVSDADPPFGYTLSGQGQGGAAGFARGSAKINLDAHGVDTLLTYKARVDVGGKLVSVGNRLLAGVATRNADQFFARFNEVAAGMAPHPARPAGALPDGAGELGTGAAPLDAALPPSLTTEPPSVVVDLAPRPGGLPEEELPREAGHPAGPRTSIAVIAAGAVAFAFILLLLYW